MAGESHAPDEGRQNDQQETVATNLRTLTQQDLSGIEQHSAVSIQEASSPAAEAEEDDDDDEEEDAKLLSALSQRLDQANALGARCEAVLRVARDKRRAAEQSGPSIRLPLRSEVADEAVTVPQSAQTSRATWSAPGEQTAQGENRPCMPRDIAGLRVHNLNHRREALNEAVAHCKKLRNQIVREVEEIQATKRLSALQSSLDQCTALTAANASQITTQASQNAARDCLVNVMMYVLIVNGLTHAEASLRLEDQVAAGVQMNERKLRTMAAEVGLTAKLEYIHQTSAKLIQKLTDQAIDHERQIKDLADQVRDLKGEMSEMAKRMESTALAPPLCHKKATTSMGLRPATNHGDGGMTQAAEANKELKAQRPSCSHPGSVPINRMETRQIQFLGIDGWQSMLSVVPGFHADNVLRLARHHQKAYGFKMTTTGDPYTDATLRFMVAVQNRQQWDSGLKKGLKNVLEEIFIRLMYAVFAWEAEKGAWQRHMRRSFRSVARALRNLITASYGDKYTRTIESLGLYRN